MGFRMRKSIKLAPGVQLNVSKRGLGASVGGGGVRYSAHSSGRRTASARTGVPGVTYQKSVSGSRTKSSRVRAATPPAPSAPPKPGLFAPRGEKQLYKAIKARDAQAIRAVGDEHADFKLPAYSLAGLMMLTSDQPTATRLLEQAFALGADPAEDAFVRKYLYTQLELTIAQGVTAELPINRDAVGLALAELKQDAGEADAAINVVEQLEPTTYAAVSLAELYSHMGRHDDVVELTDGIKNEDDATALLLVYRAVALGEQGHNDAAQEAFKETLRSRSRAASVRHLALSERARNYEAQGKKAMARKDLERILAEDSDFEGVRERLASISE